MMTRFAAMALVLAFSGLAPAQVVYFGLDNPRGTLTNSLTARAAFLSQLRNYGTDTIEAFAAFAPDPLLRFGGTGLTATTAIDFVAGFATLAVSGNNSLLDRSAGGDVFTINAPVTAFGLFITQAGDAANVNSISLLLENTALGTSKTVPAGTFGPGADFNNVFFFGVTDSAAFNRVTVLESIDSSDGILFDNVTAGFVGVQGVISLGAGPGIGVTGVNPFVPAPEPGSLALTSAALICLLSSFRARRRPST